MQQLLLCSHSILAIVCLHTSFSNENHTVSPSIKYLRFHKDYYHYNIDAFVVKFVSFHASKFSKKFHLTNLNLSINPKIKKKKIVDNIIFLYYMNTEVN